MMMIAGRAANTNDRLTDSKKSLERKGKKRGLPEMVVEGGERGVCGVRSEVREGGSE